MSGRELQGFRLSDEQVAYLRKEYTDLGTKTADPDVKGIWRLIARQEALLMIYKLHKFEVDRLSELGDNIPLINFIQQKDTP